MINIVLVNPEIPQNTGNIGRLCVALNAKLHVIKPLGFSLDSKHTKRPGLDYWDKLQLIVHDDVNSYFDFLKLQNNFVEFALSIRAQKSIFESSFLNKKCFLYFGNETSGLNKMFLDKFQGELLYIPMHADCRCLNLSNAVAIAGYEVSRQIKLSNLL